MADFPGKIGIMNTYPGVGNTMTFKLNPELKECQLVAEGFLLSSTTVTVLPAIGDEAETLTMTDMKKTCSVADLTKSIAMRSITIGGMTTGKIGVLQ